MKVLSLKNLRLTIFLLVIAIFATYFSLNTEKFKPLLNVNPGLLIVVALITLASIFLNGLFTKFILEPFKKFISVAEAFYVSVISSIGNFFAPAGTGFGIRAVYLNKKHGLPYSEFISTLSGNYVLVLLVNSVIGLLALYFLHDQYDVQYATLAIALGMMLAVALILSFIKVSSDENDQADNRGCFLRNFYRVMNGWSKINSDKKLMLKLIGLVVSNFILAALMYWTIIESLNLQIQLPELLLFTVLGSLAIFINITPANIGVKEAIFLFSAGVLGFSTSEILLIALVERGVQFSVLLILWLFVTITHTKQKVLTTNKQE